MIVYLHGFCSSPASSKARQLPDYLAGLGRADEFCCPTLPPDPARAIATIDATIDQAPTPVTLVGSSLGGFYATCIAERRGLRAVLVNPALPAHLQTVPLIGEHRNFQSGEAFSFTPAHQQSLLDMAPPQLTADRYLLLVVAGDEVLVARVTTAPFAGARQLVLPGGDHSFTRFSEYLPMIVDYGDASRSTPTPQL